MIRTAVHGFARALVGIAIVATLAMMVHVTADIAWKYVFVAPIDATLEIVAGWYMTAVVFCSIAYVELKEGHIAVDLFTRGLKPRAMGILGTFNYTVSALFTALMTWVTFEEALRRTGDNEVWETVNGYLMIWPARWFVVLGFLGLTALFALRAVDSARGRAPHAELRP